MTAARSAFAPAVLASQASFRALMEATARPGQVRPIAGPPEAPSPLSIGAATIALALVDQETPVWLDAPLSAAPEVTAWLRFHTSAPVTDDPAQAAFAFVADPERVPAFDAFALGSAEYPDRSTTIILLVETFERGPSLLLEGPGIRGSQRFAAAPLPADICDRLVANRALFPRGADLVFVTHDAVAAIPRSTRVACGG